MWEKPNVKWIKPEQESTLSPAEFSAAYGIGFARTVQPWTATTRLHSIVMIDMVSGRAVATNKTFPAAKRVVLYDASALLNLPDKRKLEPPKLPQGKRIPLDISMLPSHGGFVVERNAERLLAWFIWAQWWAGQDEDMKNVFVHSDRTNNMVTRLTTKFLALLVMSAQTQEGTHRLAEALRNFDRFTGQIQAARVCGFDPHEAIGVLLARQRFPDMPLNWTRRRERRRGLAASLTTEA